MLGEDAQAPQPTDSVIRAGRIYSGYFGRQDREIEFDPDTENHCGKCRPQAVNTAGYRNPEEAYGRKGGTATVSMLVRLLLLEETLAPHSVYY